MPKMTKFARAADCPTCGATPCHQKWKPRKVVNLDDYTPIADCDTVDAAQCPRCGLVFQVSHFENDGVYITDWDEIETVPRYCQLCGKELGLDEG